MELLTLQALKEMQPDTIFARGESLITHPWFNSNPRNLVNENGEPDTHGKKVKVNWVAVRGNWHDWCIFHSLDANLEPSDFLGGFTHLDESEDRIMKFGAKLYNAEEIKKLVSCDDEAFTYYRY